MIKEVKMYTVVCDNCGLDSCKNDEYSCWGDKEQAKEHAMNSDWLEHDEKHYCTNCFSYDDDDNLVLKPLTQPL